MAKALEREGGRITVRPRTSRYYNDKLTRRQSASLSLFDEKYILLFDDATGAFCLPEPLQAALRSTVAAIRNVYDDKKYTRLYAEWKTECEKVFSSALPRRTFPHPPSEGYSCVKAVCLSRKGLESDIRACKHDMERILRGSGRYSVAWLRKERLSWHPDRFGLKCDPDFRTELVKKATAMYATFEELLREESSREDVK